jgi:hypothetical protein
MEETERESGDWENSCLAAWLDVEVAVATYMQAEAGVCTTGMGFRFLLYTNIVRVD